MPKSIEIKAPGKGLLKKKNNAVDVIFAANSNASAIASSEVMHLISATKEQTKSKYDATTSLKSIKNTPAKILKEAVSTKCSDKGMIRDTNIGRVTVGIEHMSGEHRFLIVHFTPYT